MKRYWFALSLLLYALHYTFPLVQHWRGYEVEELFWSALFGGRLAPEGVATAWAVRWLVNSLLLGLAWLRIPEVYTWVYRRIDGTFLHQLLVGFVAFLLFCVFMVEPARWQWGMLYWAVATVLAIWAYIAVPVRLLAPPAQDLEVHFVPLEED